MRKIIFLWIVLIAGMKAFAGDKVSFTATAKPDVVVIGNQFRLSYTVTTQNVGDLQLSPIKGFEVLGGPYSSRQKSVQIINGKSISTSSITYTYLLLANEEGNFTIPGATITADGNQMVANEVHIKVVSADQANGTVSSSNKGENGGTANRESSSDTSISDTDLMIIPSVSKADVYEQEAFWLTYKVYRLADLDLRSLNVVKFPDFKGLNSQEVELPNDRKWGFEYYKGRNYRTAVYRQFVLFPQQQGKLTIESARFDVFAAKLDPAIDFNNGGNNYIEVKKTITTPPLTINVKPLAQKELKEQEVNQQEQQQKRQSSENQQEKKQMSKEDVEQLLNTLMQNEKDW